MYLRITEPMSVTRNIIELFPASFNVAEKIINPRWRVTTSMKERS